MRLPASKLHWDRIRENLARRGDAPHLVARIAMAAPPDLHPHTEVVISFTQAELITWWNEIIEPRATLPRSMSDLDIVLRGVGATL